MKCIDKIMDFSYKFWKIFIIACIVLFIIIQFTSFDGGTFVVYTNSDKRINQTYVLKGNGSVTITYTSLNFRDEIETRTENGYWNNTSDGCIEVVYDDGKYNVFFDLSLGEVYFGYSNYRSRIGHEFIEID